MPTPDAAEALEQAARELARAKAPAEHERALRTLKAAAVAFAEDVLAARPEPEAEPRAPLNLNEIKKCPKCRTKGAIGNLFGVKTVRGVQRAQSWCRHCRAGTSYYSRERKYRTRGSG